ncbi:pyrimidine-nucleoside phosphorylase [Bacillus sp. FJAT-42376]|uniref:pyrimidine-nucleoside phosphorylase n=1 Tax=Bacillus sp. FJAT-42376 TaxID=2014076 RepID=UPI000F50327C|nr:pyrimidine-nucleoside phosphorylase [Bacillus sp. FJAT-42376]AZB43414.1 pyrimidine-nucleoside phosphorylase [Bacillus sp. FJAT-42376]
MRMVDIIQKKRDGKLLSKEEIEFAVNGYKNDSIPDYQMSSFLMSVYFKGMTKEEVSWLTDAMVNSGETVDLSGINGIKVDKHSTGGVGDKISLIVAPLVASVGVPVAKMSGRGLGHTGGTIDKLEAVEGFSVELSGKQFIDNVNRHGISIIGQSGDLVPADKKIYALRDVTATVDSIPLIASSIMSKKIAMGADAIVLDVKTGAGAFMKTLDRAKDLASTMVEIGSHLNRNTIAVITDMNQPLGYEVGNANEIKEVIEVLQGNGSEDLIEISMAIAVQMSILGGIYKTEEEARKGLTQAIESGEALGKFKEFISAQNGNAAQIDSINLLPQAKHHVEVKSKQSGYVRDINAEEIGVAALLLGAGRQTKEDQIDYSAGVTLKKKVGDQVQEGDVIAVLHFNKEDHQQAVDTLYHAFTYSDQKPEKRPFVYEIISK